jgi:hypothetical protein
MATFNLNNFRSFVNKGLAKPNRFEIQINLPSSIANTPAAQQLGTQDRTISIACEISHLPQLMLHIKPYVIYGPAQQRVITSDYGGDNIDMTFLLDKDMYIKTFFDTWIHNIVYPSTFNVNYLENYASDIIIKQLDEHDNIKYQATLISTFPKGISPLTLDYSATNQVHKMTVSFAYRKWSTYHVPTGLDSTSTNSFPNDTKDPITFTPLTV